MTTREATIERVLPDIFYEDPEPVEDGMQQELTITLLAFTLRWWFSQRADVFVSAGGFIFWNPANGNERIAPDCYIKLGVAPVFVCQFPNYFVWEVGSPPDFVLEVASPSTARNDLGHKRDLYARLGIPEYWKLDPTGGELYGVALMGERLVDGEYVPFELNAGPDGSVWSHSEVLNLNFLWDGEQFEIRDPLTDRTINPADLKRQAIEGRNEERQARLESEARTERERTRADAAESRADAAESRAETERQARLEVEARLQQLMEEREQR